MWELFKPFIIKWGAFIGGILLILFKVRQSGRKEEEQRSMLETLRGIQIRDKIESDITNLSDDKLNKLYKNEVKRD